jgi:hypothetical protein
MLQSALFTALFVLFILSALVNVMAADNIVFVDFADATPGSAMQTVDDPVMGGKSSSSGHVVAGEYLVWEGTVRIVNFLQGLGFCNLRSQEHPNLSVLENTRGIAFHIKSSASSFFIPWESIYKMDFICLVASLLHIWHQPRKWMGIMM